MLDEAEISGLIMAKVSRTMLACARADALIATCLDGPEALADLRRMLDHVRLEAAAACCRIGMQGPFCRADDVLEAMRRELVPVRTALEATL